MHCEKYFLYFIFKIKDLFGKISHTTHPPTQISLVWDGHCGFCKFWKTRWEAHSPSEIRFCTYQECAEEFPDIPLKEFKKASRLIETSGNVYSGPDSAYRILWLQGDKKWYDWYTSYGWFRKMSDHGYNHIAKNRHFYFRLTKLLVGKDPLNFKPYWLFYLILILALLFIF